MKKTHFILLFLLKLSVYAEIPQPIWERENRSPTSTVEIVEYINEATPHLDTQTRTAIEKGRAASNSPAVLLSLVKKAQWREKISAAASPWKQQSEQAEEETPKKKKDVYYATLDDMMGDLTCPEAEKLPPLTIKQAQKARAVYEDLMQRIHNTNDFLDNLGKYTLALRNSSQSREIYNRAYDLYWKNKYERAKKLFRLLTAPENINGFTKGNAHYHLGWCDMFQRRERVSAFSHFLMTQKYPSCLVLTAYAYLYAAQSLIEMDMPYHALALLAVDVPNIDFNEIAYTRHIRSAIIRESLKDYSNAVRHLQCAVSLKPHRTNEIEAYIKDIPDNQNLWNCYATNMWNDKDITECIINALTNDVTTPNDPLFFDAVSHDWPAPDEIPLCIATNRVLNNNIFTRTARKLPGINHTTKGD